MAKSRMIQIDGLRFCTIAYVMFRHWITYPVNGIDGIASTMAVNLFFIISSFLITGILIDAKNSNQNTTSDFFTLRQFYIRRFLRIFPIYYLVIFIAYILNLPTAREYLGWYLTYTTNISWFYHGINHSCFSHLWTLAIEEQFYLLFPFLVLFIPNKYLVKTFVLIIIFSLISKLIPYTFTHNSDDINYMANNLLPGCFDCFGIGALLAYYKAFELEKLERMLNNRFFFFSAFALNVVLFMVHYYNHNSVLVVLFWQFTSCVFCFWVVGMVSLRLFKGVFKLILENRVVTYLGELSYGLYVYHNFVPTVLFMTGLKYHSFKGALFVYAIPYFFITIGLAMLSWHFYEKPLNNLKRYFKYTR